MGVLGRGIHRHPWIFHFLFDFQMGTWYIHGTFYLSGRSLYCGYCQCPAPAVRVFYSVRTDGSVATATICSSRTQINYKVGCRALMAN